MWLKKYLRNSRNTRFLKSNGDRRLLILPERITHSTGLSLKKHRQRRQNASIFFDKPVLQHAESDKSKFCPSTTLRCENIRKERSALQPLLLGPALQLGGALPTSTTHKSHSRTMRFRASYNKLILKTIGNRKGDCAWSCSRWQTQPEKICKSQRTNQCHSLRTLYWFVLCNLQIFSGCVCHLEQLHAQSPFLFPIVFSINLIPFFDICSVDLLAVFQHGCSGVCATSLGPRCAVATVAVCGFGSWSLVKLVFDCGTPCQISPLPPTPSQTEVCSTITMGESIHEKAYIQVRPSSFSQSNALRE